MRCVKYLGQHLSAGDYDPQVAACQFRVAGFNAFTALGAPIMEVTEKAGPGVGQLKPSADLCNRASWMASCSEFR
jgi:hypothetical protein